MRHAVGTIICLIVMGFAASAAAQNARTVMRDRAPGWEVRAATERAEREPGLTRELAPDANQTATGGPSGGIPGQSGN